MYIYRIYDDYVDKMAKDAKKCIIKHEIKFENYTNCLQKNETILKTRQRFRSKTHNVFIEEVRYKYNIARQIALVARLH